MTTKHQKHTESEPRATQASPVHNGRLRGQDETLMDALRQGEAAQSNEVRAMISNSLKNVSRS